jgi:catechol 2,3-dioxygenase-like lactoylglutathione lyase family enzyme
MAHSIEPHLWVRDLEASKIWYEALGFEELQRNPPDPNWYQLGRDGAALMITVLPVDVAENQQYLAQVARRAGAGGAVSLYLHVDDAASLCERVRAEGIGPIEDLWDPWWGGRQFTIEDPDGNWWTIYQDTV